MLNVCYLCSQQSKAGILAGDIGNWEILGQHLKALSQKGFSGNLTPLSTISSFTQLWKDAAAESGTFNKRCRASILEWFCTLQYLFSTSTRNIHLVNNSDFFPRINLKKIKTLLVILVAEHCLSFFKRLPSVSHCYSKKQIYFSASEIETLARET